MATSDLNCHFVSRFLTKPWEFGQRRLWYYDFGSRTLKDRSSETLFALEGLHSDRTEGLLNRYVETPLSRARADLTGAVSDGMVDDSNPDIFRALRLLLLLQPLRSSGDDTASRTLAEIIALKPMEIDQMVAQWQRLYRLVRVRAHDEMPLFYPSAGMFHLPLLRSTGAFEWALAIPLTESYAFAFIPREIDLAVLRGIWTGGFVSNASVGLSSSRVVVHPAAVASCSREELFRVIEQCRADQSRIEARRLELNTRRSMAGPLVQFDGVRFQSPFSEALPGA
ncbi:MAG: hypothetical protein HYY93_08505 [Planctomycetes bacterium]|nr:hypothetical protein [Planctomycetota bacterium]